MQVALAWLLRRSPNILLIPGTSSLAHLRENIAAAEIVIPEDAAAELDGIGRGGLRERPARVPSPSKGGSAQPRRRCSVDPLQILQVHRALPSLKVAEPPLACCTPLMAWSPLS